MEQETTYDLFETALNSAKKKGGDREALKIEKTKGFYFPTRESAEKRRSIVQAELARMYKGKDKNNGPCQISPHCWIKELGLNKVVFEKEGNEYGATYTVDEATGEVRISKPVPVQAVYVATGRGEGMEVETEGETDDGY